jgi:osmotically inducible protein OsmC
LINGKQKGDDQREARRRKPMATERKAEVTWRGDLMSGDGEIDEVSSGAIRDLDVTWKSRSEEPGGMTSPEELIAAAHATCFSMALSNGLAKDGHAPEQLETSAVVTFQPPEGITKIALKVDGRVPDIDGDQFQRAAEQAKENCPVSKALAGVPEITLEARLVT